MNLFFTALAMLSGGPAMIEPSLPSPELAFVGFGGSPDPIYVADPSTTPIEQELRKRLVEKSGGLAGGAIGAAAGAWIGLSVGNAPGAVLGAYIGWFVGETIGEVVGGRMIPPPNNKK